MIMNQLKTFKNNMFGELPVIVVNGTEWFGATEAATALSFSNPYDAIKNHIDGDDLAVHEVIDNLGRKQRKKFTNESGLYALIFGAAKQGNNSEIKENAKIYKRWVTGEVLPAIRQHGGYLTPDKVAEVLLNPDTIIQLATQLKQEQEERFKLQTKIEQDKPLVHFAESLQISKDSILVNDLSKLLKQKGVDIGEKRLFRWLRENGYLIKSGSEYNMPTQRSMNQGLFEIKTGSRNGSDGTIKMTRTPKVTGKGQMYFINKFLNKDLSLVL